MREFEMVISKETLIQSYIGTTGNKVITALSLNRLARHGRALAGCLVPLTAVAAANCVNIPLMRITELQNGIELQNESGIEVGERQSQPSRYCEFLWLRPVWTIILFYITVLSPIIMNYIEKRNILRKVKWATAPIQVIICGICLTFAIPLCCALFVQRILISVDKLEFEVQKEI
ncbi:hypothetical protein HZH68_002630 [Vespula germanica]|uniref:Uncharacterized protein n=1 Tax=Vespula germanica TaxID=30212 RepID=A0A834NML0_VESGE|nr:hypothetical protein HZH68_002630 [Vespula germanica]